jgi:replicative DNA helicase
MTAGLALGELAAIGGRTSHGKTALLCALARRLAEAGTRVDILTLEESDDELVKRMVASLTGISSVRLKDGSLSRDEFAAAERAVERLQALPLRITSLETIRSLDEDSVVGVAAASTAPVVLIDHLQKVITAGESRVYGLERLLNRLHAVALKYGRVIVVAAQLSREMDAQRRPPELRDLRDSGAIEQSARQVWLIYWPVKHDRTRDVTHFEIYVAKNSGGGTGIAPLGYEAACGRFSDRDEEAS